MLAYVDVDVYVDVVGGRQPLFLSLLYHLYAKMPHV